MWSPRRSGRGYTLLELMALVVILCVVLLVVLPAFTRAREHARQSSCASNLKQVGLAFLMYCQDYDEHVPAAWRGPEGSQARPEGRYTWRAMLYPYVRNSQILFCPSEKVPNPWDPAPGTEWRGGSSYGANTVHGDPGLPTDPFCGKAVLGPPPQPQQVERGVREHPPWVQFPAETFTFAEVQGNGRPWLGYPSNHHGFLRSGDPAAERHNRGANYAYLDGHVQWQQPEGGSCGTASSGDRCPWSLE